MSNPQITQRPFSIARDLIHEQKYDQNARQNAPNLVKELPGINSEIQTLIDQYNTSENRDEKIIVLKGIQKKIQDTDERFSCTEYTSCVPYQAMHDAVLD